MTHKFQPLTSTFWRLRPLSLFLLLLALLTAACGSSVAIESASSQTSADSGGAGDSIQDSDDRGQQSDTESKEPDGVVPPLYDEEVVESMLLDDSVLGDGWTAEPATEQNDPEFNQIMTEVAQNIESCGEMLRQGFISAENGLDPLADHDNVVKADSPKYSRGSDMVSFGSRVYTTAAEAQKPFDIIADAGFAPCMSEAFPQLLQRTFDDRGIPATVADVTYETPVVPGHESFSFVLKMRVEVEGEPEPMTISFEMYVARQDRGVVLSSINQLSGQVDSAAIISAMEDRLVTNMGR